MLRRSLTFCAFTLLVWIIAAGLMAAEPEFSADFVTTTVTGSQTSGRIYIKGDKIRQDFFVDGKSTYSTISFLTPKSIFTLYPEKRYDEDALPVDPYQLPTEEHTLQVLGTEQLNGYDCERAQYTYAKKSSGIWVTWYSSQLNYVLKIEKKNANGKTLISKELKNIKRETLNEALFEIPLGFKKVPLYGDIPVSYYTGKSEHTPFSYIYLLPDNGKGKNGKKLPLILYLHGTGGLGNDLNIIGRDISVSLILKNTKGRCIILAPQCPPDDSVEMTHKWNALYLDSLLEEVIEKLAVDEKRIYVTGNSMGGYGAWRLAANYPRRFAALVPLCGGGDPQLAFRLKNIPTWAFHGDLDLSVPVSESRAMVNALRASGGNVKYTEYTGKTHEIWVDTFSNPELYKWLFQQKQP